MNTINELRAIRDLLADRGSWTQRVVAADDHGKPVDMVKDPRAVKWCIFGACLKVNASRTTENVLNNLAPADGLGRGGMIEFNDRESTTHSDVLALIDNAIAAIEREAIRA